jgi:hypothetical protein
MGAGAQEYRAFERLKVAINDVLDAECQRKESLRYFLLDLRGGGIKVSNSQVIFKTIDLPVSGAYRGSVLHPRSAELYSALSESEKAQLREHYFAKLKAIEQEFPDLKGEFPEQFR